MSQELKLIKIEREKKRLTVKNKKKNMAQTIRRGRECSKENIELYAKLSLEFKNLDEEKNNAIMQISSLYQKYILDKSLNKCIRISPARNNLT